MMPLLSWRHQEYKIQHNSDLISSKLKTFLETAIGHLSGGLDVCPNVGVAESPFSEVILKYYLADRSGRT